MENSDVREEDETTTFNDLGLCETLIEACKKLGWQRPSRIQREAIPQALAGKDILGLAETGSGKTGAFALPIVHQLLSQLSTLSVLVLTPTRELAHQMHQQFVHLTTGSALKTMLLIGGMEAVDQVIELAKKPHIIIATPGRMLEHLQNTKGFNLNNLRFLVLDEADKILNMDFEEEVTEIMKLIGKKRQAFLFSATMTNKVAKLQKACLRDPTKVEVSFKYKTPYTLIQRYLLVPNKHKEVYLFYLIKHLFKNKNTTTANNKKNNGNNENNNSTNNNRNNNVNNNNNNNQTSIIIFCNTCIKTVLISRTLKHLNFNSIFLHGQLSQSKRLECLQKFRDFRKNILVATDVASRGLDIPGVDAVINYDLPDHNKDYFHRVGRTARAGKSGQAFSIVTQYDIKELLGIEGLLESEMDAVEFDKKEALRCEEEVYEAKKIAKRELAELEKRKSQKDSKKVAKRKGNDEDDEEEDDGDHDDAAGVRRKFKKSF